MAKKEVYQTLYRTRVVYIILVTIILGTFFSFNNDLKEALSEGDFLYFVPYFILMISAYYFFHICGSNPGYADLTQKPEDAQDIEMEMTDVIARRQELSISMTENNEREHRESLLSSHTALSDSNDSFFDEVGSDEGDRRSNNNREENRAHRNQESVRRANRSLHPMVPERRYCELCNILQPYRTKHCHLCERCINKFDHHCVWIGSCVGELNHRKFWVFLLLQTSLQVWTYFIVDSGLDAIYIEEKADTADEINNDYKYVLFMLIAFILFLITLFTGALLVYHTYLISTNQTTWEVTKRYFELFENIS